MLRAVIISPDQELIARLDDLMTRVGRVALVKSSNRYLQGFELERFLRANAPDVVFLSIHDLQHAIDMNRAMDQVLPGVQVVAVDRKCDPAVLLDLMHHGVREFLVYPFEAATFASAMDRVGAILEKRPTTVENSEEIYVFLPSKAGSGTSTIAVNASLALSRIPSNPTLLVDLDLNSGLIGFMLRVDSSHTIYEAADNSTKLDEQLWPQLVASTGSLDVLPAGRLDPQARIDPVQIRNLLGFARRIYKSICIDLSGNMEKFSLDLMHDARRIFVVCTPEIPSLHLARQKIQLIQNLDLGDRVCVLLNRSTKRPLITTKHIEQLLGVGVFQEFPNDYVGVHQSVTTGKAVDIKSELGVQFTKLAQELTGTTGAAGKTKKAKGKGLAGLFGFLPKLAMPAPKSGGVK